MLCSNLAPDIKLGVGVADSTSATKRIVLDANVLLTGLFVPQSKSREVILAVLRGEFVGYVIENTIEESEGAIARAARQTGVDLLQSFRDAIRLVRLITLPRISRDEGRAYAAIKGTGDKAVAAAAAKLSADICTNDLADFKEGHRYGLRITTPQHLTADGSVGLHTLVPGLVVTPSQGAIYAEVTQLNWAGVNFPDGAADNFYVFDAENIGCCHYNVKSRSFVAHIDAGPSVSVPYNVVAASELPLHFVVTYDCASEASIYISPAAKASSNDSWTPTPLVVAPRTWIGCDRRGANQLNGCLRLVYGVPYRVTERAARNMMTGATVNNPWERLGLEDIIKFCVLGAQ